MACNFIKNGKCIKLNEVTRQTISVNSMLKLVIAFFVLLALVSTSSMAEGKADGVRKIFRKMLKVELSPEEVLKKYLAAKTWEERLPLVRNPNKVKSLMKEHYGENYKGPAKYIEMSNPEEIIENAKDNVYASRVVFERGKNVFGGTVEDAINYLIIKTPDGYKIDWEASTIYNPMSWVAFKVQRPSTPNKFRVMGELSDYYDDGVIRQGMPGFYYSIELSAVEEGKIVPLFLYAYIGKESPDGRRLFEILKDGKSKPLILELHWEPGCAILSIDKFIQPGFLEYDDESGNSSGERKRTDLSHQPHKAN
ncbi:MAG: hypothetical protein WC421_08890 [Elusimicrobiales bacterium]